MKSTAAALGASTGMPMDPVTHVPPVRMPMRAATSGLVLVLLVLSVFAVAVSVTSSRGAAHAQRSAAASDLYERASEALLAQEESAEEVVAHDDVESHGEYAAAQRLTRSALHDLSQVGVDVHGPGDVDDLLAMHRRYGGAVQAMFAVAGTTRKRRSPTRTSSWTGTSTRWPPRSTPTRRLARSRRAVR